MAKNRKHPSTQSRANVGSQAPAERAAAPVPSVPSSQLGVILRRLAIPVAAVWALAAVVYGVSASGVSLPTWLPRTLLGLAVLVTGLAGFFLFWILRQTKKTQAVAGLISQAHSAEERKDAIEKLDRDFKKSDPAAVFAKAQLQMQEDPQVALRTLEQIDLGKVLPNVADEARSQRAMIHLMIGQVTQAKPLAEGINLKRHEDPRSRAMMVAVIAETLARSGQAKRAADTLGLIDAADPALDQVSPQLWRAHAYVSAYTNDMRGMKRALRKLTEKEPRLLAGFMAKKTHPMLQKEAKMMLEQSGVIKRQVQMVRR